METNEVVAGAALAVIGLAAVADSRQPDRSRSNGESCPICGESVDARGLHGHVRFAHDKTVEEAKEAIE